MGEKIKVAILEDHQGMVDGYHYRLGGAADIEIVATVSFGEDLETMLASTAVDVLVLDVGVPTSPTNSNPYPIRYLIPRLVEAYPNLAILIVTMHAHRSLVQSLMEAGANGYILKDDQNAIRDLAAVIRTVAAGGVYMSPVAYQQFIRHNAGDPGQQLTQRQLEALSLCAAYPEASTAELASKMNVANSTLRNLLSSTYLKMSVRTRSAAITRARQQGLLPPESPPLAVGMFDD